MDVINVSLYASKNTLTELTHAYCNCSRRRIRDSAMHSVMVLDMCVQECLGNKRLVTQFTLVWSLAGVVPHVY